MNRLRRVAACVGLLAVIATANGQEAMRSWLSPSFGEQQFEFKYDTRAYFNEDVGQQRTRLHMVRHDFRLSVPVYQDDAHEWRVHARARAYDIDTGARIPRTWETFPSELWDLRVGANYRHRFDNGWIAGGDVTIGSASDRPFASSEEWIGNATGFLRVPHTENNAWVFFLNYSSNREFWQHVPIPGAGYQFQAGNVRGLVGLPFTTVNWEPIDRLTLEASYFVPRTVHAQIGYRIVDQVQLYAGFDWDNDRFLRHDRREVDDRLFYYEKRVMGGVRWDISEAVWLDFAGGFAFDRFFFEGEDYADRHANRFEVDDGPLLMLELGVRL